MKFKICEQWIIKNIIQLFFNANPAITKLTYLGVAAISDFTFFVML
jgi:hypothetical protein